jgi:hypothetical protein
MMYSERNLTADVRVGQFVKARNAVRFRILIDYKIFFP